MSGTFLQQIQDAAIRDAPVQTQADLTGPGCRVALAASMHLLRQARQSRGVEFRAVEALVAGEAAAEVAVGPEIREK